MIIALFDLPCPHCDTQYDSGLSAVGYFVLKVWELHKRSPLAEYEMAVDADGVECDPLFTVTFDIAGGKTTAATKCDVMTYSPVSVPS